MTKKRKTESNKPQPTTTAAKAVVSQPANNKTDNQPKSNIARYVSFGLLLGVIGLVGFVFFEVMLSFLIPLFLAAILVVVFRPLHRWFLEKCGGRQRLSALLTTIAVLLTVLVPISILFFMALVEGRDVIGQFNAAKVEDGIRTIRTNLRLDLPAARQIREIESRLGELQQSGALDGKQIDQHQSSLFEIQEAAKVLGKETGQDWPPESSEASLHLNSVAESSPAETDDPTTVEPSEIGPPKSHWQQFAENLQTARKLQFASNLTRIESEDAATSDRRMEENRTYRNLINDTAKEFSDFKSELLGGKTRAWLAELVNPTEQEFEQYTASVIKYLQDKLFKFGGGAASFMGNTIFGFIIMIIGLYFFLLDGPGMIATLQGLSPIDDQHEQELVTEFAKVSRAVVVATLLSALVQGILAGIGFYFAGLDSIFLLTVLSAVLAMVPFVGAAAVWVPCCLYLYLFENNLTAAIGLAIYGTAVISMADNVIKPYVLHGQSNLHPLLALLSVLGGVATLGPIGILVGPMVVAFFQTLLKILQREIQSIESEDNATAAAESS